GKSTAAWCAEPISALESLRPLVGAGFRGWHLVGHGAAVVVPKLRVYRLRFQDWRWARHQLWRATKHGSSDCRHGGVPRQHEELTPRWRRSIQNQTLDDVSLGRTSSGHEGFAN